MISAGKNIGELNASEAKGMLDIITNYTQSFILLNQYDSHSLQTQNLNENITYEIEYEEAFAAIQELKRQLMAAKEANAQTKECTTSIKTIESCFLSKSHAFKGDLETGFMFKPGILLNILVQKHTLHKSNKPGIYYPRQSTP
ncbi:MAG: hypothetical protein EAY81_00075 [Bacteroidetes bacterium]|nr:MAG: hypothetical protein EAY81_00075 [Bacteroidota bacterium]